MISLEFGLQPAAYIKERKTPSTRKPFVQINVVRVGHNVNCLQMEAGAGVIDQLFNRSLGK